jgi:hypothetical protein
MILCVIQSAARIPDLAHVLASLPGFFPFGFAQGFGWWKQ